MKIAIINIYFGKFPSWFGLWLKSCEFNKDIDFILFTDNEFNLDIPANLKVVYTNLSEIEELIQLKLEELCIIKKPYKICDYRPMFGLIFENYLSGYDYWGHCDSDMIFGDLCYFFDKYNLEKYDKFLNYGHLSLYRNTKKNNTVFKLEGSQCGDWREIIKDENNHAFDEQDGIYRIYKENQLPVFDKRIFADISTIYKNFKLAKKDKNYKKQVFFWENGKVYRAYIENRKINFEEFIYIHIQKRQFDEPCFDVVKTNSFYVTKNGFKQKTISEITCSDVYKYNKPQCRLLDYYQLVRFRYKDIIRGFLIRLGLYKKDK